VSAGQGVKSFGAQRGRQLAVRLGSLIDDDAPTLQTQESGSESQSDGHLVIARAFGVGRPALDLVRVLLTSVDRTGLRLPG
jgi:hypothetical protein